MLSKRNINRIKQRVAERVAALIEESHDELIAASNNAYHEHDSTKPFKFRFGFGVEVEDELGTDRVTTTLKYTVSHKRGVEDVIDNTPDMFPGPQEVRDAND